MINAEQIKEILSLYEKHGWNLRRVLLCAELKNSLDAENLFGNCEITEAEFNAMWFSRPSKYGKTAWELRHLSINPFALFEVSDEESLNQETVEELENRMRNFASNKTSNKNA